MYIDEPKHYDPHPNMPWAQKSADPIRYGLWKTSEDVLCTWFVIPHMLYCIEILEEFKGQSSISNSSCCLLNYSWSVWAMCNILLKEATSTRNKELGMKDCTWFATMFWMLACIKFMSTWMSRLKVSEQNIAQSIITSSIVWDACRHLRVHPWSYHFTKEIQTPCTRCKGK